MSQLCVSRHSLPFCDVAFSGGECDAYLCDRAAVEPVLLGIALAVNLVEGLLGGVFELSFSLLEAEIPMVNLIGEVPVTAGRPFFRPTTR